jgi:hypothetical protein
MNLWKYKRERNQGSARIVLKADEATLVESTVATMSRASVHTERLLSRRLSAWLASNTASKQSGPFSCELFHCQPWTDVSKRPSVPLQSRGEIMSRVDLRAAAGRVECHVFG